jgi:tellurite resistance protein TerC
MFSSEVIFFSIFLFFVLGMLLLDLGVFSKKSHIVSFKEAAAWSLVWVSFAIAFYFFLLYYGEIIHGIDNIEELQAIIAAYHGDVEVTGNFEQDLATYKRDMAIDFITGYVIEYSLSVDNIFVIIMIFASFGVREVYYKKVLFLGILGAIVMRFTFIFVGAALLHKFAWLMYVFGAFLIYTGLKTFFSKEEEENIDSQEHPTVKFISKYINVFPRYVKGHFFVKRKTDGKFLITPLFVVILVIEATDLIFAVDSVPAIFAITQDPYIVFFSNIFAILGLRSMFFFLANIMHYFHYLKVGLSVLLTYIGIKMILHDWLKSVGFDTLYSLFIILGILVISIAASLLFPKKEKEEEVAKKLPA